MQTIQQLLLVVVLLRLCCTQCCASSRTLSQELPNAAATATEDAVDTAAATPQAPRCEWYPPPPPGIKMSEWTARWPQECMGTRVDNWCEAKCLQGYRDWPFAPRIYCHPNADGRADWALPIKGQCVAYCPGLPPNIDGVMWPFNCSNGLVEGTSKRPWAPPSTCFGQCRRGYIGDPTPVAKCVSVAGGESAPARWRIVQGACRDNVCDGVPRPTRPGQAQAGYFPSNCSREVGSTCEAICRQGFVPDPVPVATCVPPNETYPYARWEVDPSGVCRDNECSMPPGSSGAIRNADWPFNCTNSVVGTTCTATCRKGFVGDPFPTAVCTKPKDNETYADWVIKDSDGCKDPTACRGEPCQDIAFAIGDSCVPTRGEQPSLPGTDQFSCTCFDNYRWDAGSRSCVAASLLAFAVAQPVDTTDKRAAGPSQAPEASWIYKYGAKKPSQIGTANWIAQDKGTSNANMYAVAVADAKTAWAVGSKGIIKRYDGTAWTVQRPSTAGAPTLRAVAALGSKKAWAGGDNGVALYYDGSSWRDVAVNQGVSINSIAAVREPGGVETVWAVAGDERNANKLTGYIFKWDAQASNWGTPVEFANITLRGVAVLDRYGAWVVGYANRGELRNRGVLMNWDYATQIWTNINLAQQGNNVLVRFNSIVAHNHGMLTLAGYTERADQSSGSDTTGIIMYFTYLKDLVEYWYGARYSVIGGFATVSKFEDIAGASLSTTVAVGSFKQFFANNGGYPAVAWQKLGYRDMAQKANVSIAYDQEVVGVAVEYVDV